MEIEKNKEEFLRLLRTTNRKGIEEVIAGLEKLGFFTAPASAKHHLAEAGGLCQHSLNVYRQFEAIFKAQTELDARLHDIPFESAIIVSLLHDVCKAEIYKIEKKWKKNTQNQWEQYDAYGYDYSHCPLGHGEKSVIRLLRMGLELTDAEIAAIRWHMAGWDLSDSRETRENFGKACEKYPLLSILIAADELATRITEVANG